MALSDELSNLDATALADMVRRKQVKPVELVQCAIDRIEKLNPLINAVVTRMDDEAFPTAEAAASEAPFAGVPFLLKDLVASCRGVRMTSGSRCASNYVPDRDSELVTRYRRAGLIFVGKTNTSEFGILPTTEPEIFGPTRNRKQLEACPSPASGGPAPTG